MAHRACPNVPEAEARGAVLRPRAAPLVLWVGLFALVAPACSLAAAPLPPARPKGLQAPAPAVVGRMPAVRAVPLPPRRPSELVEEDAEAEAEAERQHAAQQEAPADTPSADGFVREPARPGPRPQLASRQTGQDAASAVGVVPLPPERPQSPGTTGAPPPSAPASDPSPGAPATPLVMPQACADLIADGEIEASLETSIIPNPACGTFVPVRLTAVRLGNGKMIPLKPAAISRCEMTMAAANWMRDSLAPAVAAAGGALAAIRIADSYNCRPRNRVAGAKMSEHGRGNAVDVGGFELEDGRIWIVARGGLPMALRSPMKDSACTRFATVLGPGSDGYHEDHIHVDLAQRRIDFKLCQWNLDAGAAVAARKDKPTQDGSSASAGARGGRGTEGEAAPADAEAEAAHDGEPLPLPPPKPDAPARTGAAAGKAASPKGPTGAKGPANPKGRQSGSAQTNDGGSKGGSAGQGQAN